MLSSSQEQLLSTQFITGVITSGVMEPREIIREARERHNWSQKDLADRAGVSQVAIVKIESGATVHSKFLPKIAQILGLDLADLDHTLKSVALPAPDRPFTGDIRPDFRVYA